MARVTTTTLDLGRHKWVAENTQNLSREQIAAAHQSLLAELEKLTGRAPATAEPTTRARHLGDLIGALKNHHQDSHVMVEFLGRRSYAGRCLSYRGYYEEIAISPDGEHPTTVGELVKNLKSLLRTGVTGYKGGQSPVFETTPVWVSAHGEVSGQHVTGVRLDGDTVIVMTSYER